MEEFTSRFRPWFLACKVEKLSRSEAMLLERKLKSLNKIVYLNTAGFSGILTPMYLTWGAGMFESSSRNILQLLS